MNMQTLFGALQPKVVLGVGAHPDDLDFGFAGSAAAFAQQGAQVYYLIVTDGSKGSADRAAVPEQLTALRRDEQRAAARILGVSDVFFLDYVDGTLQNTLELRRDIARFIRRLKPDVVVTMDPSVLYAVEHGFINHPDHRAAGQATLDAVFPLARDHLSFPELLAEGLEPHQTATVLLVNFTDRNFAVDISKTLPLKLQALAAHISQMLHLQATQAKVTTWAATAGSAYGVTHAESFVRIDVD